MYLPVSFRCVDNQSVLSHSRRLHFGPRPPKQEAILGKMTKNRAHKALRFWVRRLVGDIGSIRRQEFLRHLGVFTTK